MGFIKPSYVDLYEHYVIRGRPIHEISDDLGYAVGTIYNYLKKYGIKTRNQMESYNLLKEKGWKYPEESIKARLEKMKDYKPSDKTRKKMSESKIKGGIGHKKKRTDGYIAIYFPDHPKSNSDGYIMEHDLVMECYIGRHLSEDECVHHVNKIRDDNRLCNLKLMTKTEHMRFHMMERHKEKKEK